MVFSLYKTIWGYLKMLVGFILVFVGCIDFFAADAEIDLPKC
jgi:uncharacterized membrane protein